MPQFVERERLVPYKARAADGAPKQRSIGPGRLESKAIPLAASHFAIFPHECAIRLAGCAGGSYLKEREKVRHQSLAMLAQHRFGVELKTEATFFADRDSLKYAVIAACMHLYLRRKRIGIEYQ